MLLAQQSSNFDLDFAGFQKGDVIIAINGSPAGRWTLASVRNVFTSERLE